MSDISGFLGSVFGADGWLKDQQHARAVYRDENLYDLAPKAGWIYYVKIGINPAVKNKLNKTWANRFAQNVGLLAKSVDLPKFKVATEVVNQYNRKTVIQTKQSYDPITIIFHDDMANATTNLWNEYYKYYNADTISSISANFKNSKSLPSFADTKYSDSAYDYGLANGQDAPFFTNIDIFLLNKQRFMCTTLINPIITEWRHSQADQTQGNKLMESQMTVAYESVLYTTGRSSQVGFTSDHYDNSPSPLSIAGGAANSLFGPGGVVPGASQLLGDLGDVNASTNPLAIAGLGLRAAQLTKNFNALPPGALQKEGYSIITGQLGILARTGGFGSLGATILGSGAAGAVTNLFSGFSNSSVDPLTNASSTGVPANGNLYKFQNPAYNAATAFVGPPGSAASVATTPLPNATVGGSIPVPGGPTLV